MQAVYMIFVFLGLIATVFSVPALISPRAFGLPHRILVIPMALSMVAAIGAVALICPHEIDKSSDVYGTRVVGAMLLTIWALIAAPCIWVARRSADVGVWQRIKMEWAKSREEMRLHDERRKKAVKLNKVSKAEKAESGIAARMEKTAARLEKLAAKLEAKAEAVQIRNEARATKEREKREAIHAQRLLAEIQREAESKARADEALGVDGRLQREFDRLQDGTITLEAYRQAVYDEAQNLRERRAELRLERNILGEDLYEFEIDQLEEDAEAIRWRKDWLKNKAYKESIARPGFAERGKWCRFEYVDAHGELSKRHVVNWERRGPYIVGFDKDAEGERTFRQDRISEWIAG